MWARHGEGVLSRHGESVDSSQRGSWLDMRFVQIGSSMRRISRANRAWFNETLDPVWFVEALVQCDLAKSLVRQTSGLALS